MLLGHTTLFPRLTPAHNFVFDAVINGVLCRMFPSPAHTAFFTDFYRDDLFPECLLRPPRDWPRGTKAAAPGLDGLPAQPDFDVSSWLDNNTDYDVGKYLDSHPGFDEHAWLNSQPDFSVSSWLANQTDFGVSKWLENQPNFNMTEWLDTH